jgi:hypothetical protein
MKKLAIAFALVSAPAWGQDAKPFHLELNAAQVQVVLNGLAELKLRESIDTFVTIKRQLDEQSPPPRGQAERDPSPRKPVD